MSRHGWIIVFLLLGVSLGPAIAVPLARAPFAVSFQAGPQAGGTEVMNLVGHRGKLYAGIGYWMDDQRPPGTQILVLDGPAAAWRVDHTFGEKLSDGSPRFRRLTALLSVTFGCDGQGRRLDPPVTLLVAANDNAQPGGTHGGAARLLPTIVFTRDDDTGQWTGTAVGSAQTRTIRALALHRDSATHVDRIFAGAFPAGIYSGVYDPQVPGRIQWDAQPELTGFKHRVMSMEVCNGVLYASAKPDVYRRTDGATPRWERVFSYADDHHPRLSGLRSLTAVKNPGGEAPALLGGMEGLGAAARLVRFDPYRDYAATTEINLSRVISDAWHVAPVGNLIGAYTDMPLVRDPSGDFARLIGLGFGTKNHCPLPGKTHSLWYLVRRGASDYRLHEIPSLDYPTAQPNPPAVRTIAVSPSPEDRGQIVYLGCYDTNFVPCHDTARIYRAGLETVLGR